MYPFQVSEVGIEYVVNSMRRMPYYVTPDGEVKYPWGLGGSSRVPAEMPEGDFGEFWLELNAYWADSPSWFYVKIRRSKGVLEILRTLEKRNGSWCDAPTPEELASL
jgi:hypothetical protein